MKTKHARRAVLPTVDFKDPNWAEKLRNDNVYVKAEIVDLQEKTGIPAINRVCKAVVSEGKIVHVASDHYGLLQNENFFLEIERKLIDADIKYVTQSVNRGDSSFAVDFILTDDRYSFTVNDGGKDDMLHLMIRAYNSYDGSSNATGLIGVHRRVCSNGLTSTMFDIDFKVRHMANVTEITVPKLDTLVSNFMDNKFVTIKKRYDALSKKKIADIDGYMEFMCDKSKLFTYVNDKGELSRSAEKVLNTIEHESVQLNVKPSYWLAYNAFNEYLYSTARTFANQHKLDEKLLAWTEEYLQKN